MGRVEVSEVEWDGLERGEEGCVCWVDRMYRGME